MTVIATGWAVQSPDGCIIAVCDPDATEDEAWLVAYGHLPMKVMTEAKSRGARAFRCEVREIGEKE